MLPGKGVAVLALALGFVTSFGVWFYVERSTAEARVVHMVPVVVAAQDIPARTLLTADMVKVSEVPQDARHVSALVDSGLAVGKVTKGAVTKDEQVLTSKLFAERNETGLAFLVPPGRRAVSVAVSEVVGSGGLIVPADHVDVVVVYKDNLVNKDGTPAANNNEKVWFSSLVLQDIEVLAVAQTVVGDDMSAANAKSPLDVGAFASSSASSKSDAVRRIDPAPQPNAKTATLSVTPEQAVKLALAESLGTLRLALRPNGDRTIISAPETLFAPIMQAPGISVPAAR